MPCGLLCGRLALPVARIIVQRGEAVGVHAVDVESAVEVIDFVLEDAGVPAGGLDHAGTSAFIEALDADGAGARDGGHEAGDAEAAFEKFHVVVAYRGELRIYDHVK